MTSPDIEVLEKRKTGQKTLKNLEVLENIRSIDNNLTDCLEKYDTDMWEQIIERYNLIKQADPDKLKDILLKRTQSRKNMTCFPNCKFNWRCCGINGLK